MGQKIGFVVETLDRRQAGILSSLRSDSDAFKTFEKIWYAVQTLSTYKGLHHALHQLQIRNLSELPAAAKQIQDDEQTDKLRAFQDIVRKCPVLARPLVLQLPDQANLRDVENRWIDQMEGAVEKLQEHINREEGREVSFQINMILKILGEQLPRLNQYIFLAAKNLPLQALADLMDRVNSAEQSEDLARASAFLRQVRAVLLSRVIEHDKWQDADVALWALDNMFSRTARETFDNFAYDWPKASDLVVKIADREPDAKWAINVKGYAAKVEEELLRLESVLSSSSEAVQATKSDGKLNSRYKNFCQEARYRFFLVDQMLHSECSVLIDIKSPIQSIMGNARNGPTS